MKKILFAFLLLANIAFSQSKVDTVFIFDKSGIKIGNAILQRQIQVDTLKVLVHDTIRINVPCDTSSLQQNPILRVLYVGSEFATIFKDPVQSLLLKKYLKDYKYNGVSFYGLSNISKTDWNILRAFNEDLRNNYGIVLIEATASSSSSFINDRTQFNLGCTNSKQKFDRFNMEKEYWNAKDASGKITTASVLAAWKLDSIELKKSFDASHAAGCSFVWYHGWDLDYQIPLHLVANQDCLMYHDYQLTPSTTYVDSRLKRANSAQAMMNPTKNKDVQILVSAETLFMRNYLKTHTIDDLINFFQPYVDSFSNLKFKGIQVFMYSEIIQSQPAKNSTAKIMLNVQGNDSTLTSKSHIETAIERK